MSEKTQQRMVGATGFEPVAPTIPIQGNLAIPAVTPVEHRQPTAAEKEFSPQLSPNPPTGPTVKRHKSKQDYGTPWELIWACEGRFGPIMWDLAASPENTKGPAFYDEEFDSLKQRWHEHRGVLWLNPPFANIEPWAEKCAFESRSDLGHERARILFLTPASVGANWFRDHVHGKAFVVGLNGRITFEGTSDPYPKDCILSAFGFGPPGFDVWDWRKAWMHFLSVCSGIEAASVAWHPLGWRAAAFSEIEPFPCAVLEQRWPGVPNLGDMTQHEHWKLSGTELVVGGTPCQAFSVAGLRKGLADPRGNLTLVFLGIVDQIRPRGVVWENVPGVLSDASGAFGAFLGGLGQLGYGFAYRVLDAQYFGVPQRRRRVFVVGHIGGLWQRAAAVLFERAGLCRDPSPRRETGQRVALPVTGRVDRGGSHREAEGNNLVAPIAFGAKDSGADCGEEVSPTLRSSNHDQSKPNSGWNVAIAIQEVSKRTGRSTDDVACGIGIASDGDPMFTLQSGAQHGIAHALRSEGFDASEDGTGRGTPLVACPVAVRRLTPRECERLQGFHDDYTLIPWRGRPAAQCPDGPRYKALGNSMAVPVMRWIGERIKLVDAI
jgi:DNA (cytosine-5)-methyltransferase 1